MNDKEEVVERLLDEHNKCIETGFSSSVEFKKLLSYEQGDGGEVEILFEDICQECGKNIGKEIQVFKYVNTMEVNEDG